MALPPPPRAVRTLTRVSCPTAAPADVPLPAKKEEAHGTRKRRWTDKLRCKIVELVRPSRRMVMTKVEPHCDFERKRLQRAIAKHQARPRRAVTEVGNKQHCDADVEKQRLEREISEHQARRRQSLRWGGQALQNDSRPNDDYEGAVEAVNLDARPKKGILKVRPAVAATEEKESPTLVELLFPTGFLNKPPQSFRSSGSEKGSAFLMSVIAAADNAEKKKGAGSRTRIIDRDLVDRWSEAKENNLCRGRHLRDYCPFQRSDDESAPVPEETLPPETDHVEDVRPVKTGLPFDSPAAEAEFVKAIVSRHLLKDDFINRYAFKRSCRRFMQRQQSLQGGDGSAGGCPEPGRKVTFRGC